jgi:hypothetical protein
MCLGDMAEDPNIELALLALKSATFWLRTIQEGETGIAEFRVYGLSVIAKLDEANDYLAKSLESLRERTRTD